MRALRALGRAIRAFFQRSLTIDPRAAGLFRIALAVLLCLDCIRHWSEAGLLYSNDGVLSNHYHLFQPASGYLFSFFHAFSTLREVELLFALGLFCHLNLLVGHRTKLFAFLSLLFVTSRDSRNPLVENGGYVVQNLACLWAVFAPIEKRFSVDAWRASWRSVKETSTADLRSHLSTNFIGVPGRSLIGVIAISNLAIVYFFNVVNKTGHIWRQGDTVHYVLYINRMVTGLAVFMREHVPAVVLRVSDFCVLATEATICLSILSPYARKYTRLLAIVLIFGLHSALGFAMRLGPFSWFLMAWSLLLLLPIHFDRASKVYRARSMPCEVAIDPSDAFALAVGRVLVRLDHDRRIHFVDAPDGVLLGARRTQEEAWTTDLRQSLGLVADALPYGRWLLGALRIASLGLFDRVLSWVVRERARLVRFFAVTTAPAADALERGPLARKVVRGRVALRELVLAYLMLCCTLQAWMENKVIPASLPPPLKPGQELRSDEKKAYDFLKRTLGEHVIHLKPEESPTFLNVSITYPRIFQGWGMFAPNPIRDDGVLAIDALTIDGRHIDPLTGKPPDLDLTDSRGEGLSQLRQDYGNRIRLDRNDRYREGLRDYLSRYPERTHRPNDELIAIDVYWVRAMCPPPGQTKLTDNEAIPILSWRKQGYRRDPDQPQMPPKLKTRSAEKDKDDKDTKNENKE